MFAALDLAASGKKAEVIELRDEEPVRPQRVKLRGLAGETISMEDASRISQMLVTPPGVELSDEENAKKAKAQAILKKWNEEKNIQIKDVQRILKYTIDVGFVSGTTDRLNHNVAFHFDTQVVGYDNDSMHVICNRRGDAAEEAYSVPVNNVIISTGKTADAAMFLPGDAPVMEPLETQPMWPTHGTMALELPRGSAVGALREDFTAEEDLHFLDACKALGWEGVDVPTAYAFSNDGTTKVDTMTKISFSCEVPNSFAGLAPEEQRASMVAWGKLLVARNYPEVDQASLRGRYSDPAEADKPGRDVKKRKIASVFRVTKTAVRVASQDIGTGLHQGAVILIGDAAQSADYNRVEGVPNGFLGARAAVRQIVAASDDPVASFDHAEFNREHVDSVIASESKGAELVAGVLEHRKKLYGETMALIGGGSLSAPDAARYAGYAQDLLEEIQKTDPSFHAVGMAVD